MKKKHIFLNGFMGAGKSKVGPILAERLGMSFVDLDKQIEQEAGKKIKEIFEEESEAAFRKKEHAMLERLIASTKISVVSLGGGALVNPENKKSAEAAGTVVYLKCSPEVILERVKHSSKRPLLDVERDDHFEENLLKKIKDMLEQRKDVYESAHIIIDRDGYEPEQVVDLIVKRLKKV